MPCLIILDFTRSFPIFPESQSNSQNKETTSQTVMFFQTINNFYSIPQPFPLYLGQRHRVGQPSPYEDAFFQHPHFLRRFGREPLMEFQMGNPWMDAFFSGGGNPPPPAAASMLSIPSKSKKFRVARWFAQSAKKNSMLPKKRLTKKRLSCLATTISIRSVLFLGLKTTTHARPVASNCRRKILIMMNNSRHECNSDL